MSFVLLTEDSRPGYYLWLYMLHIKPDIPSQLQANTEHTNEIGISIMGLKSKSILKQ